MKVKEMIELLSGFDDEREVLAPMVYDYGYSREFHFIERDNGVIEIVENKDMNDNEVGKDD